MKQRLYFVFKTRFYSGSYAVLLSRITTRPFSKPGENVVLYSRRTDRFGRACQCILSDQLNTSKIIRTKRSKFSDLMYFFLKKNALWANPGVWNVKILVSNQDCIDFSSKSVKGLSCIINENHLVSMLSWYWTETIRGKRTLNPKSTVRSNLPVKVETNWW